MTAPKEIIDLVRRFDEHKEAYKSGHYNETQLRREFLDPFFKALGWDIDNTLGHAEQYKDVVHEDSIKIGGITKAPDYCFRIGGVRKFFLEAKKPAVAIKEDISPAYQLRRYAWSAKLPLSILSNFEEFAVYDCRVRPEMTDKAATARILYLTYHQYEEKLDEIIAIFSKEAVLKGSFDKYAKTNKGKRGTTEVDDAFLNEIESWRQHLAQNIALRNPELSPGALNYSVQQIIDRIIFLRICEDRGIEPYGRLQALQNGSNIYARLCELFHKADQRYNSGLFHFTEEKGRYQPPDKLTLDLHIDDKALKDIFKHLYYPDSPYEFSVLSADILGQVYEQFLGKVIRLTPAHHAVVEDKPEVKKAGGVYYTPTYIVDYIVQNTVGKLIEGKTPKQVERLRILDPACGSGSFLLGAYQYLMDWYLKWYEQNEPDKHARGRPPRIHRATGEWRLTTAERKRIVLNNIYGVDIDAQAAEVTKLSLLLKVLEGESAQTLNTQILLFHERALPDLGDNIKCGNSLIGPNFYEGYLINPFDDGERLRLNVFDWEKEFSEIMQHGGFDIVIGNPPWGALYGETELEYLRQENRAIIVRMIDSFMYFVYQGARKLKPGGQFGMILPDVILYQQDNHKLREFILNNFNIHKVLNLGNVFEKVTRPASILIFGQENAHQDVIDVADFSNVDKAEKPKAILNKNYYSSILQKSLSETSGILFITSNLSHYPILEKIKLVPNDPLDSLVDEDGIQRGVSPDLKGAFLVGSQTAKKCNLEKHKLRDVLTGGRHVRRYFIDRPDLLLIYTSRSDNFKELPNIRAYIDQFKSQITCKEVKENKHPLYALHRPRDEKIFQKKEKLLGVITEDEIIVALDNMKTYATDGLYLFSARQDVDIRYLMALLNSRLFIFIYRLLSIEKGRVLAQVKPTVLSKLPIRRINFHDQLDLVRHERIIALVEHMQSLQKLLAIAKTPSESDHLRRQIDVTNDQIDKLVYELYGLTAEEIRVVDEQKRATPVSGLAQPHC